MNNLYKRPMFRKGGSAEGGITSGLGRPGYAENGAVEELTTEEKILQDAGDQGTMSTRDRMLKAVGAQPNKQNFNDFLINFGLNMASNAPSGNIFQTAAAQAKDPYADFSKANQAEQNLLRQVGLEAEGIDISADIAAKAAKSAEEFTGGQLDKKIKAEKDLYELEKGNTKRALIDNEIAIYLDPSDPTYTDYNTAENAAKWKYETSLDYKGRDLGGVFNQKQSQSVKERDKKAKNMGKKDGVGTIYYDPYKNIVYEVGKNEEGKFAMIEVVNSGITVDKTLKEPEIELGDAVPKTKMIGTAEVIDKVSPIDLGFENRPVFESIDEIRAVLTQPMTGKEIKEKYEINFAINPFTVFNPANQ